MADKTVLKLNPDGVKNLRTIVTGSYFFNVTEGSMKNPQTGKDRYGIVATEPGGLNNIDIVKLAVATAVAYDLKIPDSVTVSKANTKKESDSDPMSWNRGSFLGDDSEKSVVDLVKSFSKHESAQSEPWSFIERAMHVGLEKLAKDVKDKKQLWKIMS